MGDAASAAAILGLLVLAGCSLDVVLRPLPRLAPRIQRLRRHAFWAVLAALYLAALAAI